MIIKPPFIVHMHKTIVNAKHLESSFTSRHVLIEEMKFSEFCAVLQNAREKHTEIFVQVRRTVNFNSCRALPISKGIITTTVNGENLQFGEGGRDVVKKNHVNLASSASI